MPHTLTFSHLAEYDTSQAGVTLEINLKLVGSTTSFTAKVDTGSTDCIFARQHGEALGLDIESGEPIKVSTATGTFLTYRHFVTLEVLDYEFDVGVYFAADEHYARDVLGRHGFLDRLRIGLDDYAGKLYLSRNVDE